MAKYLFYRMTHDTGFAPNPFWGYCTLAACTPNHQRAKLCQGDFVIGVEGLGLAKKRRQKGYKSQVEQSLVYVMEVEETLDLESYFQDSRFQGKKYKNGNGWIKRRGDNVYYRENGEFRWIRGHFHEHKDKKLKFVNCYEIRNEYKKLKEEKGYGVIAQDLKGNIVFISKKFMYFGDLCISFENFFLPLLKNGRSFKYSHDGDGLLEEFKEFIGRLKNKYGYGQHGDPIHRQLKTNFIQKNIGNLSCGNNK
jgi:hypothetical protein